MIVYFKMIMISKLELINPCCVNKYFKLETCLLKVNRAVALLDGQVLVAAICECV
jgi:hypothetical protein